MIAALILSATALALPPIPGIQEGQLAVYSSGSFLTLAGAALVSTGLSTWLDDDPTLNFYQARLGYMGAGEHNLFIQNFGVEKRLSPWFGVATELNSQQWIQAGSSRGMGGGLMTYYRWHAFGRRTFSPYLEAGAGVFFGARPFPADGTHFTFNLTTALGVEYTFSDNRRLRLGYGHVHHSNNDIVMPNPGMDAYGFTLSHAWQWK